MRSSQSFAAAIPTADPASPGMIQRSFVLSAFPSLAGFSLTRITVEGGVAYAPALIALQISTPEVAIILTTLGTLIGGVVWLVRLEGRLNTAVTLAATECTQRRADTAAVNHRLDRISSALGILE